MPYGDRTGPWGRGFRTGRGAGYCAGYDMPGYMNPGPGFGKGRGMGMGRGRGFGGGRGRGWWFRRDEIYPPEPYYRPEPYYDLYYGPAPHAKPDPEEEKAYLEDLVKSLEDELGSVKERLKELSKGKEKPQK